MAGEPERPIKEFDQDELGREGFVDRLCRALIDETTTKSKGIVVGVTGPWGSGKTSLLNLLHRRIEQKYADVVVVRFDPWLVSGRNDLISAFISELIASIKSNPSVNKKLRSFVKSVAKYGAHVSPLADVWAPGSSAVIKGGLKAVETALTRDDSIHAQRERLVAELNLGADCSVHRRARSRRRCRGSHGCPACAVRR